MADHRSTYPAGGRLAARQAETCAELVGRLAGLRQIWAGRQQEAVYTRESSDGPSAGIASARADLIGQLLADLDRVVNGG